MNEKSGKGINYSCIVTYCNGNRRGYTVWAENRKNVFEKLMSHVNFDLVSKVEIAEIIMEQDMID